MDGSSVWRVIKMVLTVVFIGPFILAGRGIKKLSKSIERKWRKWRK